MRSRTLMMVTLIGLSLSQTMVFGQTVSGKAPAKAKPSVHNWHRGVNPQPESSKKTNHPTDADTYAVNGGKPPGAPDKDAPKKEWSGAH